MHSPDQSPLGKASAYADQYDPSLLFPLARAPKRAEIGITGSVPFVGADLWTAFELSWLNERGKPQVSTFDAAAWNAAGVQLADPIVGTCCTVDTDLPRIRFVMDPLKPVFQGTRRIRESRADE